MNESIKHIWLNIQDIKEMAEFGDDYCDEAIELMSQLSQIIRDSVARGIKGPGYSREISALANQLKIRVIYEPK